MNWEIIGWLAIAASGIAIVVNGFAGKVRAAATAGAGTINTAEPPAPNAWLEIAWPVFFIAVMGMLSLKDVMSFPAVLLLATAVTGAISLAEALVLGRRRAPGAAMPEAIEMAKSFFPVILIVFLLRSFLYEPFKIPSGSMEPTLVAGDYILVNKYTYGVRLPVIDKKIFEIGQPRRGEVMVFHHPSEPNKDLIKRIVGLPGDKVEYRDKQLTINDRVVGLQKRGTYNSTDDPSAARRFDAYREQLGDTPHNMLLDPRAVPINLAGVRQFPGVNLCQYRADGFTCTVPAGHYFMMGDSRDNSDDSRYWGFMPEADIVGKAVRIWMNLGEWGRIGTAIK